MSDYKDRPDGRQDPVYTHDEGDGSFSRANAAHLRGWDSTDTAWYRLPVDHSTGALQVVIAGGAGSGGTSSADGSAYTAGTTAGTPLMAARDDSGTTTLAEDKVGIVRATTNRALHVNLRDASGNEVSVGGGTQYTEDAAAAADPTGTVPILVRKDTPSTTVSTDGDNIAQRGTNYGAAYVTLLDTSGSAVSVGGGTQYDEDTASTAADKVTMAGVVRKDTAATLVDTDGDRTQLQVTAAGKLWTSATVDAALPAGTNAIGKLAANDGVDIGDVTINNASGGSAVNIQDGGNSITVDGTVAVSGTVTVDSELTTADLDTGAGTDTRAVVGLAGAASGGAVLVQATSGGALKHDVTSLAGTAVDTNSGTKSGGTQRVVLATDQPQLTNALKVDGSAVTQPVSGTVTANQSNVTPVLKNALSTTVFSVIASQAAVLEDYYIYNPNSSAAYVQILDVATAGGVTLGTTTPKWSIAIPPTSAANLSRLGLSFANGIQVAATTTATGSSAPATALDTNWGYR